MEDLAIAAPPRRRFARRRRDPDTLVVETVAQHADSLLRVARRYTHCEADAEDAYQRALEVFVKAAHRLDPETAYKWIHTVVKHEAFAVREQRSRLVGVQDDATLDALDDGRHVASVEERSERFEELTRAAEALKRLKPQEVTALVLKAQGLSYKEIAERQQWTYTKVNRCITEGRRSFLERYEGIRSGAECDRWAGVLSAMADGEATAAQLVDVRPHLRNCPGCRALLAGMQRSGGAVTGVLPPVLLAGGGAGAGLLDRLSELLLGAQERMVAPVIKAHAALETASASKVAAVAASAAAIAGGGVAADRHANADDVRTVRTPSALVAPAAPSTTTVAPDPSGAPAARPAALRKEEPDGRHAERRPAAASPPPSDAPATTEFDPLARAEEPKPEPKRATTRPASDASAGDEFGFGG